ncbi:hypothetical protein K491DRAFT_420678 [Lophiostoma macrostomum CBS 122681]|uniref:Uncharacterized protein n=1 Tax=Lophiostoma macrostomum CBS 122681 TaxID=1314788 RepID=A0A6A6TRV6_9PLEO|nr:hypothetical protein K491DRAFT_420678 [Lophiostoma macrostomum CBS 122681]
MVSWENGEGDGEVDEVGWVALAAVIAIMVASMPSSLSVHYTDSRTPKPPDADQKWRLLKLSLTFMSELWDGHTRRQRNRQSEPWKSRNVSKLHRPTKSPIKVKATTPRVDEPGESPAEEFNLVWRCGPPPQLKRHRRCVWIQQPRQDECKLRRFREHCTTEVSKSRNPKVISM